MHLEAGGPSHTGPLPPCLWFSGNRLAEKGHRACGLLSICLPCPLPPEHSKPAPLCRGALETPAVLRADPRHQDRLLRVAPPPPSERAPAWGQPPLPVPRTALAMRCRCVPGACSPHGVRGNSTGVPRGTHFPLPAHKAEGAMSSRDWGCPLETGPGLSLPPAGSPTFRELSFHL